MIKSITVNVDPEPEETYLNTRISIYSKPVNGFDVAPLLLKASELSETNLGHFAVIVTALQTEAAIGGWWVTNAIVEPGQPQAPAFTIPLSTDPPTRTLDFILSDKSVTGQRTRVLNTKDMPVEVVDAIFAIWDDFDT